MKFILGCVFWISLPGFSQPGVYDTLPIKLVGEPDTMPVYVPFATTALSSAIIWPANYSFTGSLAYDYSSWSGTVSLFAWVPVCGDTYHTNGKLSTRAECVDSVLHGKVTYWDDSGHKYAEDTYAEGHKIKSKNYDEAGRTTWVYHYDYKGNYHGICIDYDHEYGGRTETHYHHGTRHGIERMVYEDNRSTCYRYDMDVLIEEKTLDENGKVTGFYRYDGQGHRLLEKKEFDEGRLHLHEWHSDDDDTGFYKTWNEDGILTSQGYFSRGNKVGQWLTWSNPGAEIYHYSYYDDAGILLRETRIEGSVIISENEYENGRLKSNLQRNSEADTTSYTAYYENGRTEKKWRPDGKPDCHYTAVIPEGTYTWVFIGSGFFTLADTTYSFVNNDYHYNYWIPLKCWVIYGGDTMREDYIQNKADNLSQPPTAVASNRYAYDVTTGTWVKNGPWKNYFGNELLSVQTYTNGILEGWQLICNPQSDIKRIEGYFKSGYKQGEWTTQFVDGRKLVFTYVNSVENGEYRSYNETGALLESVYYQDGIKNGPLVLYHANGVLKTEGAFVNGKESGWWKFYDESGTLVLEGLMENGARVKTWFEYEPGSDNRSRQRYKNGIAV
jgi:antitoxin component YwqK of YwqJK toxin-antitoxin module